MIDPRAALDAIGLLPDTEIDIADAALQLARVDAPDADWQAVRTDSCIKLDVRLVLRTTDGALIVMTDQCLRAGPPSVIEKLDKGEAVDAGSYYFRMNPVFETSAPKYDWMNRMIAIGTGHRLPDGPIYSIFEVL